MMRLSVVDTHNGGGGEITVEFQEFADRRRGMFAPYTSFIQKVANRVVLVLHAPNTGVLIASISSTRECFRFSRAAGRQGDTQRVMELDVQVIQFLEVSVYAFLQGLGDEFFHKGFNKLG